MIPLFVISQQQAQKLEKVEDLFKYLKDSSTKVTIKS